MYDYQDNNTISDFFDNETIQQCLLVPEDDHIEIGVRYIIYGPLLFFVILFGAFGNLLACLVFQKRICKEPVQDQRTAKVPKMHRYLAILSVWDFMLLLSTFFLYNLPYLVYGKQRLYGSYVVIYPYAYAMACVSRTGSIWILIASAVDRYFAVCHPFAHHIYSTTRKTNTVLLVCCGLSIVYGMPRYYHMTIETCFDLISEQFTSVAVESDIRSNPFYWYGYKIAADYCLVSVGPFVVLLYLSVAVCLAVRKSMQLRDAYVSQIMAGTRLAGSVAGTLAGRGLLLEPTKRNHARSEDARRGATRFRRHARGCIYSYQETQNSLNFMLISVLVKFLVCHSLPAVLDVCETTMNKNAFETTEMDDFMQAANALVVLNGSLNIVIYSVCSRRFRVGVSKILFWGLKRKRNRSGSLTTDVRLNGN